LGKRYLGTIGRPRDFIGGTGGREERCKDTQNASEAVRKPVGRPRERRRVRFHKALWGDEKEQKKKGGAL